MRLALLRTTVDWLTLSQALKYYVTQNTSFRGPLNYYRTTKIRFEEEKGECGLLVYEPT